MENDYIMKIIKTTLQGLAYVLKGKHSMENSIDENTNNLVLTEEQALRLTIIKYINECKINEAENLLFEAVYSHKSPELLELALFFYEEINKFSLDKLIDCNFSKEEILDGLNTIKKIYNV